MPPPLPRGLEDANDLLERLRAAHARAERARLELERAQAQVLALEEQLGASVWPAADSEAGTWGVQKALKRADGRTRELVADGLRGHVNAAWRSRWANHVLQLCIDKLPVPSVEFIAQELLEPVEGGRGRHLDEAVRHEFGVRVLQRLLEHALPSAAGTHARVLQAVVEQAAGLANDQFGNFLLQTILEHGSDITRFEIAARLVATAAELAHQRYGSYVVVRTLEFCPHTELIRNLQSIRRRSYSGSWVHRRMKELGLLDAPAPSEGLQ